MRLHRPGQSTSVTLVDISQEPLLLSLEPLPSDVDKVYTISEEDVGTAFLGFRLEGASSGSHWKLIVTPVSYGKKEGDYAHGKPFAVAPTVVDDSLFFRVPLHATWFRLGDRVGLACFLYPLDAQQETSLEPPVAQKIIMIHRVSSVTPPGVGFLVDKQKCVDISTMEQPDRTVLSVSRDHLDSARLAFSLTGKSRKKVYLHWKSDALQQHMSWRFSEESPLVFDDFKLFGHVRALDFEVLLSSSVEEPFPVLYSRRFHVEILGRDDQPRTCTLDVTAVDPALPLSRDNTDYVFHGSISRAVLRDEDRFIFTLMTSLDVLIDSKNYTFGELSSKKYFSFATGKFDVPLQFALPSGPSCLLSLRLEVRDMHDNALLGDYEFPVPYLAEGFREISIDTHSLDSSHLRLAAADHLEVAVPFQNEIIIPFLVSSFPENIFTLSAFFIGTDRRQFLDSQSFKDKFFLTSTSFFRVIGDEATLEIYISSSRTPLFNQVIFVKGFYLSALSFAPSRLSGLTSRQIAPPLRQIAAPPESPWATARAQVAVADVEEDVPLVYLDTADLVTDAEVIEEEKT